MNPTFPQIPQRHDAENFNPPHLPVPLAKIPFQEGGRVSSVA